MSQPAMSASPVEPSSPPSENVQRGTLFALIVVPLGIVAWDVLWSVGFVASIVAFGVAYGAVRLYRAGSGGRVGRSGAFAIAIITIATLALAFVSGFAVDNVGEYARVTQSSIPEALVSSRFWSFLPQWFSDRSVLISLLLAILFGALGCFSILRNAFRASRPAGAVAPTIVDPNSPFGQPASPTLMQPSNPEGTPAVPAPPSPEAPTGEPDDPKQP